MARYITSESVRVIVTPSKEVIVLNSGQQGAPGVSEADMDYADNGDFLPVLSNGTGQGVWATSSVQVIGDVRTLAGTPGMFLYCSVAGTTGGSEPVPTETAEIVADGTASWIAVGYDETVIYAGSAVPGTLDSDPDWKIKRTILRADDDYGGKWAGGLATFNQIWDNHLHLIYS